MTRGPLNRPYFIAGVLIALAGAVFFSTKAVFVKLAYRDTSVGAVPLLALRMVFSLPFFLTSAFMSYGKKENKPLSLRQWILVAAVGCMGYYVSSLLDFLGLQFVTAGTERLILFIYPTLVVLISAVIFRVRISRYQWMAILLTYSGLFLAFQGELSWDDTDPDFHKGVALIFACAVTYALYIVGSGRLIPAVGARRFNSYAMTFACAAVILHYAITDDLNLLELEPLVYFYAAAMALVGTVIPSYLVTEGIRRIGSDNAAIVGSVGPVSTIIQANLFLGEPILALQIAGTVLILAGVLMISKKPAREAAGRN